MINYEKLERYADILIRIGVNLRRGQGLHVTVPLEGIDLARAVAESAFQAGASDVVFQFTDEPLDELSALHADHTLALERLEAQFDLWNELCKKNYAFLRLYAPGFSSVESNMAERLSEWNMKNAALSSALRQSSMDKGWTCIACCPTKRWAERVFPELSPDDALERLYSVLFYITRADSPDPVKDWERHSGFIVAQGEKLTAAAYDSLHITGPGTDLSVGLIPTHFWGGGRFINPMGVYAIPNIPTEELATTPDFRRVNGVVSSVRPLNFQGDVIDGFSIRFQDGRAVEWHAERGEDTLTRILTHDEGSAYLGEVAVVPVGGLIGSTGITFLCTLLDENATCHLALGAGFPMYVADKNYLDRVNRSALHVDFMIGNEKLTISASDSAGRETMIFDQGQWTI